MPKEGKNRLLLSLSIMLVISAGLFTAVPAWSETNLCADCHEEVNAAFPKTAHGRVGLSHDFDCQSCHGSTATHLDSPSRNNIVSFIKESEQSAAEQNRLCLECHNTTPQVALWEMSHHSRNDVACVSCHSIHSQRSQVDQPEVCYSCHRSLRLAANKISHHPIAEGKVKCSDCHNSHGTLSTKMLTEDSTNQLCYRCHAEKRGPFVWEHPPVAENCATCHEPHGSRHENLLKEKVANLCQDCHNADLHSSRTYDGKAGFSSTGRARSIGFAGRSCLNCHGNVHGSTHFDQRSFTR